jgi:ribosomal protein L9
VSLLEKIVNQKLNRMTKEELLKLAKKHQISITVQQAEQIIPQIKGKNINIFNSTERAQLIKKIAKITSPEVARKINKLFQESLG